MPKLARTADPSASGDMQAVIDVAFSSGEGACSAMESADHDSHGFPFPLLLRPGQSGDDRGVPRYLVRRRRRQARSESMVSDAVCALNALASARGNGRLQLEAPRRAKSEAEISQTRDLVLCHIGRACKTVLSHSDACEATPDGALCELLRAKDLDDIDVDSSVAAYDPSKLKVLRGETRPKLASGLVGERGRYYLEHAHTLIERPAEEIAELEHGVQPHWDPKLRNSRSARREFIRQLDKVDLIT